MVVLNYLSLRSGTLFPPENRIYLKQILFQTLMMIKDSDLKRSQTIYTFSTPQSLKQSAKTTPRRTN